MKLAAEMGLQPSEWDNMTPSQFCAYADGYVSRKEKEAETTNRSVYNLAALVRSTLMAKRMPKYGEVFSTKKSVQMTDEEMYNVCMALNAMFGGNVE